jgi:hypothetical protein
VGEDMSIYNPKVVNPYNQPEWINDIEFCHHDFDDEALECSEKCGLPTEDQLDELVDRAIEEKQIENYLSSKD